MNSSSGDGTTSAAICRYVDDRTIALEEEQRQLVVALANLQRDEQAILATLAAQQHAASSI